MKKLIFWKIRSDFFPLKDNLEFLLVYNRLLVAFLWSHFQTWHVASTSAYVRKFSILILAILQKAMQKNYRSNSSLTLSNDCRRVDALICFSSSEKMSSDSIANSKLWTKSIFFVINI